jgi:putative ABC transport system permease protein
VINQRSFGWSMGFSVEPAQLALGVALAVGAAFLAGVYPGRQLALAPVAKGLRTE